MNYRLSELIKSDLFRYEGENGFKAFVHAYNTFEGFKFSVWLRICHVARKKKITKYTVLPITRIIYRHYKYKFGYDIPYPIDIGPGLLIFHVGGIVFSAEKCGRNLTVSQNTTVGMTLHDGVKKFPIIGDNVYLAPGSAVIGGISVGNGVAIGTNCVLTKSVDDNSVVVGIPGKVISKNGSDKYVNNPI